MNARIVDLDGKKYLEGMPGCVVLRNESDALDLIGMGGADGINRILLHAENLDPAFFDLKTGVAGAILQKFTNYRIRAAAVIPMDYIKGRFGEMVGESNYGGDFRVFQDKEVAVRWLIRD